MTRLHDPELVGFRISQARERHHGMSLSIMLDEHPEVLAGTALFGSPEAERQRSYWNGELERANESFAPVPVSLRSRQLAALRLWLEQGDASDYEHDQRDLDVLLGDALAGEGTFMPSAARVHLRSLGLLIESADGPSASDASAA